MSKGTIAPANHAANWFAVARFPRHLQGHLRAFWHTPGARALLGMAVALEAFLLALWAVIPAASVSLSVSPLARAWPWLLAPAHLILGDTLASTSLPPGRGLLALIALGVLLVGASCAAARVLYLVPRARLSQRQLLALILGAAVIFGLTLVLLPSLPSDDVFSYILYGRISAVHGANPLISTPADFPHDPFLTLVFWRDVRSVYGPVWLLLSAGLSLLAQGFGGSLALYVALFKLLGFAAHLTNAWLIWRILGVLAPQRQRLGTMLYAWNPLCLLEFCASGHNDAVMLTLLLLAVYFLLHEWEIAALVAFGLSISIKYVPVVLVPFYLALIVRRMRGKGISWAQVGRAVAWRVGILALVIVLTTLPFWAGPATLGALLLSPPAQQLGNSPVEAISWPLRAVAQALGLSADAARNLVNTGLKTVGLLAFAALWLWEFRRTRTIEGMLTAWGWTLLWYVLVASGWFWPWYVTWVVAVVALAPWGLLTRLTLLLAAGVLTLYTFQPLYALGIYGYRSLVAFGPTLVVLALVIVQRLGWLSGRQQVSSATGADAIRDEDASGTIS